MPKYLRFIPVKTSWVRIWHRVLVVLFWLSDGAVLDS